MVELARFILRLVNSIRMFLIQIKPITGRLKGVLQALKVECVLLTDVCRWFVEISLGVLNEMKKIESFHVGDRRCESIPGCSQKVTNENWSVSRSITPALWVVMTLSKHPNRRSENSRRDCQSALHDFWYTQNTQRLVADGILSPIRSFPPIRILEECHRHVDGRRP